MRAVLHTLCFAPVLLVSTAFAGDPMPGEIEVDPSQVTYVRQDPLSYPRVASSLHWGDVTCKVTVHASSVGKVVWAEAEGCPRPFMAEINRVKSWQLVPSGSGVVFTTDLSFDGPGRKNPPVTEQALVQAAVVTQPGKHCGLEISVDEDGAVGFFATTDAERCLVRAKHGAWTPEAHFECEASFASRHGRAQGIYAVPTSSCDKQALAATRKVVNRWKWSDSGFRGDGTRYHVRITGGSPVVVPEEEVAPVEEDAPLEEAAPSEDVASTLVP